MKRFLANIPVILFFLFAVFGTVGLDDIAAIFSWIGAQRTMIQFATILLLVVIFLAAAIRILPEYERGVIFRLGRVIGSKGPGLILLIPFIDRMQKMSLRVVTLDVPTQDVITKDNVSASVDAVLYFRVIDPVKAVINVEDYDFATSQIAQTTLRSICGQVELDDLLAKRDEINQQLQEIIDKETDYWGIKVVSVEIKRLDLPDDLRKAMARQAEAEREKRAKIIGAEAEYQAAKRLTEAAHQLATEPISIQLRYLETLNSIGSKNAKTIVFPFPTELMEMFNTLRKS